MEKRKENLMVLVTVALCGAVILAFIAIALCIVVLATVSNVHKHDYSKDFLFNETYHWRECKNAACNQKEADKAPHYDMDGDGACDVCKYIALQKVILNKTSLNLTVGETDTLQAGFLPANVSSTVLWSSSDTNVVTVDNSTGDMLCTVTAVGLGTAVVTVTTADNKTATCEVTVHKHNLSLVVGRVPTCTEDGVETVAHYECSGCDKWFYDYLGTHEMTNKVSSVLQELGHDLVAFSAKNASCSEDGYNTAFYACRRCNKWFSDRDCTVEITDKSSVVIPKGHVLSLVPANSATCTANGNTAYYTCSRCGNWFSDSNGANQITNKSSVVIPKGHNYVNGVCTVCGERKPTEGLDYRVVGNEVHVYGLGMATDTDIVIASEYKNLPVTSICDSAFYGRSNLTSVTIPDSVTKMGTYVFCNCSNLENISIPDSITSLGHLTFSGCSKLQYNEFGNAKYLGNDGNPYVVLVKAKDESITSCEINDGTIIIYGDAFSDCSNLTDIVIPDGVKQLSNYAFYNCINLSSVTLSSSLTSIGNGALSGCSSLTSVTIPANVTSIGFSAFSSCNRLAEIRFAGTVAQWEAIEKGEDWNKYVPATKVICSDGEKYFVEGEHTHSLTLVPAKDATCTSVGNTVYYICNLCGKWFSDSNGTNVITDKTSVVVNKSAHNLTLVIASGATCTEDGNTAYYTCAGCDWWFSDSAAQNEITDKTSVILPKGHSYSDGVCTVCGALKPTEGLQYGIRGNEAYVSGIGTATDTDIVIASEYEGLPVTSVSDGAFRDRANITSVKIPNDVTGIGARAFSNCSSLVRVNVPDSLETISNFAFYNCNSLQYNEYDNALYLGNDDNPYVVLFKVKDKSVTSCEINETTKVIYADAFSNCSKLASIVIPDSVVSIGDFAFNCCYKLANVTLGNSIAVIGQMAFFACERLTSITIPDSVISIEHAAFDACEYLVNVTFGSGLTYIGEAAFSRCDRLTSITLPNSVTNIGNGAFYCCISLTSINIPDGVTYIDEMVFYECNNLESITISSSVSSIAKNAFTACFSLTNINYTGTVADWNKISGLEHLLADISATKVICSDGEVSLQNGDENA